MYRYTIALIIRLTIFYLWRNQNVKSRYCSVKLSLWLSRLESGHGADELSSFGHRIVLQSTLTSSWFYKTFLEEI